MGRVYTAYIAGVTYGNAKRPWASVVVVLEPCGPVRVTVAPGTARFCASIARPVIVPVVCCAEAVPAHVSMSATNKTSVDRIPSVS